MPPTDPYRDDRPTLVAEIERLRTDLASARQRRGLGPAVAALALHIVLREALSGWLNGASDARFVIAAGVVTLPVLFAAWAWVRAVRPPRRGNPS